MVTAPAPRKQYLYYHDYYQCVLCKKTALSVNVAVLISSVSCVNFCITSLSGASDTSQSSSHYLYDVLTLLFRMLLVSYYYHCDDHVSYFISWVNVGKVVHECTFTVIPLIHLCLVLHWCDINAEVE